MDAKQIGTEALEILQLKDATIHAVAHDRTKLHSAALCLALGALISSLGLVLFPLHVGLFTYRPDLAWVIGAAVGGTLGQALVLYLIGLGTEKIFHSQLSAQGFFQVLATASLVNVLGLIPGLSVFSSIWILVVTAKVLHSEGKLEAPVIALVLLLVMILFGSASYYGMGGFGMGMM